VLLAGYTPWHSLLGIAWTAATTALMFTLAGGKACAGRALGNSVLATEGRVTLVAALLATAVLLGLALNTLAGARWADPLAALVIVCYGLREARQRRAGGRRRRRRRRRPRGRRRRERRMRRRAPARCRATSKGSTPTGPRIFTDQH